MYKFIVKNIIAVTFLIFANTAFSNNCVLHLDKAFYATGEKIWYQVYLPKLLQDKTVAVKGVLVNPDGVVVRRFFHKSKKTNAIDGVLKIPYNFNSGYYKLLFKVNPKDTKEELVLVEKEIPIYSDFQMQQYEVEENINEAPAIPALQDDLNIKLSLNKEDFSARDLVNVQIEVTDKAGNPVDANYSVAVTDASLIQDAMPQVSTVVRGPAYSNEQMANLNEAIYVIGQVMDTLNEPVKVNVLSAYASEQNKFHYAKSNNDGLFTMDISNFYEEQSLQFVGFPKEIEEIKVRLIPEVNTDNKPKRVIKINEKIGKYLEYSQQRKKMAQYFEYLEDNAETQKFVNEVAELKPDYNYVISEYEKFENVASFFTELLTPLAFKKVKGRYVASMSNPRAQITALIKLGGKPLFIIDGKVTRDADFIGKINLGNVEEIDLFYIPENIRRQFKVMGAHGVVRITTIVPQFELPQNDKEDLFVVNGLQIPTEFVPFQPTPSNNSKASMPNYATPVFWSPNNAVENGKGELNYYQTDDKSTFVISVLAQSKSGKMGFVSKRYQVK
ncbi:MAG: hypothetical protein MK226_14425 [Saprospiraceae bacterium]|nr:hypothetical protein [Saprospiraceae bacterium]